MLQHTVHALQSELDNLRADNIKLYEKIKFLQSYPGRVSVQLSVCLSVHAQAQSPGTGAAHFQDAACMPLGWGRLQCSVQRSRDPTSLPGRHFGTVLRAL